MNGHTKGDWFLMGDRAIRSGAKTIAKVNSGDGISTEEADANARVLRSASEMYQLLDDLNDYFYTMEAASTNTITFGAPDELPTRVCHLLDKIKRGGLCRLIAKTS